MPTTITGQAPDGPDVPALHARLAPVLAGLAFPARRWQAVAEADLYGCDSVTRALVDRLPERTYVSFGDLVAVLATVLAGWVVPDGAAGPAAAPRSTPDRAPAARSVVPPRARRSGTGPTASAAAPASLGARPRPGRAPADPRPAV